MTPTPLTTFEQFLEAIPKDGWRLNKDHFVRRRLQCPITSLEEKPACYYNGIGREYGMSSDLMRRVTQAADRREGDLNPDFYPNHGSDRKALLSAVGLKETDHPTPHKGVT